MNVSKFYKKLTSAEVGSTKTHEIYIRMSNDFDYETFFSGTHVQNQSVIEVNFSVHIQSRKNISLPASERELRFVYFANSNKEKRIPGLGNLFKDYEVEEGDVVCLERYSTNGVPTYTLTFFGPDQIQVSPACFTITKDVQEYDKAKFRIPLHIGEASDNLKSLIRAIRTKPFVLLAGISGTGKSRIVRKLAQACLEPGSDEAKAHKPSNFEMVQVKPNWHDSSELLGYVSRIGDKPQFIVGDFLKFIAKAWENPTVPYFLCLDEMNLAPVEQYFAEYLSVVESRKLQDDCTTIVSDPLLEKEDEEWYHTLVASIATTETIRKQFLTEGICIPQNLIVIGTVNMDETTYSFSRKVLDRAMTIEMNEVDLRGGLHKSDDMLPHIKPVQILADAVEGFDVYDQNQESCDKVITYLDAVNKIIDKTPFKVAYRTRNEFLIYTVNALKLAGEDADINATISNALDEVTSMKILSRIEGDKRKVGFLSELKNIITSGLAEIDGIERSEDNSVSLSKLTTMEERLKSGYTSFWD